MLACYAKISSFKLPLSGNLTYTDCPRKKARFNGSFRLPDSVVRTIARI